MEVLLPHRVEYLVEGQVSIDEVIGTLEAQQRIVSQLGGLLDRLVDGVSVDKVELRVRSISSGSLKEAFFVALFLAYQTELKQEVPRLVEAWSGLPVDDRYDALVTVGVLLLLFYGADFAYRKFTDQLGSQKVREKIDALTDELAHLTGKSSHDVKKILDGYLGKKSRLRETAKAAIKFFRPSRNKRNEPIVVGDRRIESDVVREVPNQVNLSDLDKDDTSVPVYGTRIELRAKDHDNDGSGWGGIVRSISDARKPVRLYPNVSKDYLWANDEVWADIMVTYRSSREGPVPIRYHIMTILEGGPRGPNYQTSSDPDGSTPQ